MASSPRVFYGWWITVSFAVMVFMSAGIRHAVGPFLKPMVADLGVDRAAFSLVIALGLFLYGAFMPWVGSLADRLGPRMVTSAGALLLAISLALVGFCQNLWQLAGSFFTCGFSMSLISSHGVPMLTDHGYTPIFASWIIGVLGASSIVFTLGLGALADRFGARPVLGTIYTGRAAIFAGLYLIHDNPLVMLGIAAVGGITIAGSMSMTSMLTASIYGRYSVGSILGVIFLVHQTGAALGSWLAGALFESTGGYGAVYAVACAFLLAAGLVSLRIDSGTRVLRWAPRGAGA
jgi:MFS family permease